ncbi:hypothetical protein SHANETTE_24 [Bacillus phage Shanette]|uniref:Uncharacterized protein n=1 Tax=Bacillus phage Shanette TaxID=1296656 RepID=S5MTL3_9CAUD|nr:hypothetical protein AVV46_gp024 [Bacillus phage Shanette]AGR47142.1 hypothetical protein SHANETTE_24 [Bacillus phage Shanette]
MLPHGLLERLGTIVLPLLYQAVHKPCPAPRKCSILIVRVYRIIRILRVCCPKDIVLL